MNYHPIFRRGILVARRVEIPRVAYSGRRSYATEEPSSDLSDYPQLPDVSRQYLPPKGWQDNLMRMNHGDPLHEREEMYSMWAPDIPPLNPYRALGHFLIAASVFVGAGLVIKHFLVPDPPAARREYPFDGLLKELGGLEENKARPLVVDSSD